MTSIIIPAYNSSHILKKNLPPLISFLNEKKIESEIIVIDDGSDDFETTKKICTELNCRFLFHEKNLGKGAAVRKGMLFAKGDFRIFTDADIPFQYDAITALIQYLHEFDMVIGDRTLPQSDYFSHISCKRFWASRFFSFLTEKLLTRNFCDTQCGLKGFNAKTAIEIFSSIKINGYAFDAELIYFAMKKNYSIKKIPVNFRNSEGSGAGIFRDGIKMFFDVLRIKFFQ